MQEFFNLPVDENIKRGEFRYFIFGETLSEILGNMFTQNCVSKMFNPNLFTKKKQYSKFQLNFAYQNCGPKYWGGVKWAHTFLPKAISFKLILHLPGIDILPSPDDHVLHPADNLAVPSLRYHRSVPSVHPTVLTQHLHL